MAMDLTLFQSFGTSSRTDSAKEEPRPGERVLFPNGEDAERASSSFWVFDLSFLATVSHSRAYAHTALKGTPGAPIQFMYKLP